MQDLLRVYGLHGPIKAHGHIMQWGSVFQFTHSLFWDHITTVITVDFHFGGLEGYSLMSPAFVGDAQRRCLLPLGAGLVQVNFFGAHVLVPVLQNKSATLDQQLVCKDAKHFVAVTHGKLNYGVTGMKTSYHGFCSAYDEHCDSPWAAMIAAGVLIQTIAKVSSENKLVFVAACDYLRFMANDTAVPPAYASVAVEMHDSHQWIAALKQAIHMSTLHMHHNTHDGSIVHLTLSQISPVRVVIFGVAGLSDKLAVHKLQWSDRSGTLSIKAPVLDRDAELYKRLSGICGSCVRCSSENTTDMLREGVLMSASTRLCLDLPSNKSLKFELTLQKCTWTV